MKLKNMVTSSAFLLASVGGFITPLAAHADSVTVKSGDTASEIANSHHLTLDTFQSLNQGVDLTNINPGQTLNITKATYTVKSGDTLSAIAAKHHTNVDKLKSINHLNSDLIIVGQKLTLNDNHVVVNTKSNNQVVAQNNNQGSGQIANQTTQQSTPTITTQVQPSTQPATQTSTKQTVSDSSDESWAKSWIADRESGGSYTASNGQYYGKYQLGRNLLRGDNSPANQERVANQYVNLRYGSWVNAQKFWANHGWY